MENSKQHLIGKTQTPEPGTSVPQNIHVTKTPYPRHRIAILALTK